MSIPWEVYVRLGEHHRLVKAGEANNIGEAVVTVHGVLPDVEPAGADAYGWVYMPDEREPPTGSHRPLKANRLSGGRGVRWTRPGL